MNGQQYSNQKLLEGRTLETIFALFANTEVEHKWRQTAVTPRTQQIYTHLLADLPKEALISQGTVAGGRPHPHFKIWDLTRKQRQQCWFISPENNSALQGIYMLGKSIPSPIYNKHCLIKLVCVGFQMLFPCCKMKVAFNLSVHLAFHSFQEHLSFSAPPSPFVPKLLSLSLPLPHKTHSCPLILLSERRVGHLFP